jgi:hypothetical protein
MRKFLTSISTLPLGILFVEGEKLQGYGQRWIPKSILRGGTPEINQECIVQSDGKLAHTGFGLSQTTFIIRNSGELCFGIQLPDGRRFFVGISPQPGLEISQTEKTYAIIPSKGPLSAGNLPQRVVILSIVGSRTESNSAENVEYETRYEFLGWLFQQQYEDSVAVHDVDGPGTYTIWHSAIHHKWHDREESSIKIAFSLRDESRKWIIG